MTYKQQLRYVYRHRRNDTNEVFYIGIGTSKNRVYTTKKRNAFWQNIYNKVGRSVEIIATGLTDDEAKELEMLLIKEYGRRDLGLGPLVNMTNGGDGAVGCKRSAEAIAKTVAKTTGQKRTLETKKRISEALKGKKRGNMLNSTKEKLSNKLKGRIFSEKHKSKLRVKKKNLKEKQVTDKQLKFINAYLETNDVKIAAIIAGYSLPKNKTSQGYRLIKNKLIMNELTKLKNIKNDL